MAIVRGHVARTSVLRLYLVIEIFFAADPAAAAGIFRRRDFVPDSPWNTPIAASAPTVPADGAADVPIGLDTWLDGNAWTVPCYQATASTPPHHLLYSDGAWMKVASGRWRRFGNPPAIEADIRASARVAFPHAGNVFSTISAAAWTLPPFLSTRPAPANLTVRVAPDMLPAAGTDGHMAVAQPDGRVVESYATIILANGDVVALSTSETDPASNGDGSQNGQTASMLPAYAGLIQDDDIATGINHAMAVTIPAKLLAPAIAYPAAAFDRDAMTEAQPYAGTIPMGARLALPATLDLATLKLGTESGRAIATAARTYGFIVVDRGGAGITLRVRPNAPHPRPELHGWNQPLERDLRAIFSRVQRVPVANRAR